MYARVNYYNTLNEFLDSKFSKNKKHLIFITSKCDFTIAQLNKSKIEFYGAVFETIIYKNKVHNNGLMVFELKEETNICFIENMDNYLIEESIFSNAKSVLTVLDGFSKYTSSFLENIFEDVPLDTNVIGGGAGVFARKKKEVVFNNDGIFKDAAFLIMLNLELELGIGHGWDILDGPFIATDVKGNILKQIDYKNAFSLYKDIVERDSEVKILDKNDYNLLKDYPFGIVKLNGDSIVRDTLSVREDGSLILAGEIPSNSVINILKGEREKLLTQSYEAGKDATKNNSEVLMMFECISRSQYLKDDIEEQIGNIINDTSAKHVFGVVSIGEIANDGNKYIYFLNKSCVIGGICL